MEEKIREESLGEVINIVKGLISRVDERMGQGSRSMD